MSKAKSKAKIDAIVAALGSASEPSLAPLGHGTRREWQRVLNWLDASGLVLYFLRWLGERKRRDALPPEILLELEDRQSNNRERIRRIRQQFDMLNGDFDHAGVEYAALKGFSLVPEYCPDASARPLSDLDYLIGRSSIDRAEKILAARGYIQQMRARFSECWWTTRRGEELIFWKPARAPKSDRDRYDPDAPWTIELHIPASDPGRNEPPLPARGLRLDRRVLRQADGRDFYALPMEDMFLGQVMHAFRHWAVNSTARPSWLFELGYFLKHREDGDPLWDRVNHRMRSDSLVAEAAGLMVRLVTLVFGDVHPKAEVWAAALNPTIQRWLDLYGRESVLAGCDGYDSGLFPRSKLILFLKEEYSPDFQTGLGLRGRSLLSMRALERLTRPAEGSSNFRLEVIRRRVGWLASRSLHNARANLRYFWELPRWQGIRKSSPPLRRSSQEKSSGPFADGRLST